VKNGEEKQKSSMSLKDFCTQEYVLCKKWLLRSQKFRVIWYSMQQLFPCEGLSYVLVWCC